MKTLNEVISALPQKRQDKIGARAQEIKSAISGIFLLEYWDGNEWIKYGLYSLDKLEEAEEKLKEVKGIISHWHINTEYCELNGEFD